MYSVACLLGGNMLQVISVMFPVLCLSVLFLAKNKKEIKFPIVLLLICFSNFLFGVLSPGSRIRYTAEIINWFPEYSAFTIIDKLYIGFTSTVCNFFIAYDFFIYLFFVCSIIYNLYLKHKKATIISAFSVILLLPVAYRYLRSSILHNLLGIEYEKIMHSGNFLLIDKQNFTNIYSYWPTLLSLAIVIAIVVALRFIFKEEKFGIIYILTFIAGFLARVELGFSPTVYASGPRTMMPLYLSIFIISTKIYSDMFIKLTRHQQKIFIALFVAFGCYSYYSLLMLTLTL